MSATRPKFFRVHHFAWLDYKEATNWQARYYVARQIRDDAVPDALVLLRNAGRVLAFGEDAHQLAEILSLKTGKFNGHPMLALNRDATFRRPATTPVQLSLFSVLPEDTEDQGHATVSLQDAFGSEPARKERHITEIIDVPALCDPRLNAQSFVWYRELIPITGL